MDDPKCKNMMILNYLGRLLSFKSFFQFFSDKKLPIFNCPLDQKNGKVKIATIFTDFSVTIWMIPDVKI
jgi:hypothetical protein